MAALQGLSGLSGLSVAADPAGGSEPSLDFSSPNNSQYVGSIV